MNRQEQYRLARQALERRRQKAESDAQVARREVYAALPGLLELDTAIGAAGARAAMLAADGHAGEAKAALAEAKQAEKQKKALLKSVGVREKDLQPKYRCAKCKDTGSAGDGPGAAPCECLQNEVRRIRREQVNRAGFLSLSRFSAFSLHYYPEQMEGLPFSPRKQMGAILQTCLDYAEDFGPHSPCLYMCGDAGLGKTHLALAIASEVLDKGYDVIYVSSQHAFSRISQNRWQQDDLFESMLEADLLVLDDLGTEFLDAYVSSKLYELINARLNRPTIYTTNICDDDLLEQRYTQKISSRLLGECHYMPFQGVDIRLAKKSE